MTARPCRRWSRSSTASHENITVKPNTIEWADFYQRLPAAAKAGKGPDVGVMHLDQLATNAARNVIVPLDDLAEALELSESDFTPAVWSPGIYKDKRYGIPLDVHSLAMYYNKDHFEKAGITEAPDRRGRARGRLQEAAGRRLQAPRSGCRTSGRPT